MTPSDASRDQPAGSEPTNEEFVKRIRAEYGCDVGVASESVVCRLVREIDRLRKVSTIEARRADENWERLDRLTFDSQQSLRASEGAAPREPSEEAIQAARKASSHTAELGMADVQVPRRATIAMLRVAYAVDFGPPSAGKEQR